MSPTRTTVPWPELAALGALFVAVAAWSGAGRPVADGQVGELWLRGDSVMAGYLGQPP